MIINHTQLVLMVAVAIASGLIGVFALMRRMTLASDAMSHIALPGLAVAALFGFNPLLGAIAALLLGALLIWSISQGKGLATDLVIGVLFSASLAIGTLLSPDAEELIHVLFGAARAVTVPELILGIIGALIVIMFVLYYKHHLTLALISEDLATISGVPVRRLDLVFLLVFAVNIMLGLQFLGVLLMGSLIIVPAAIARNLGRSLDGALFIACISAICSVLIGYWIALSYGLLLGPTIISVATVFFILSLMF